MWETGITCIASYRRSREIALLPVIWDLLDLSWRCFVPGREAGQLVTVVVLAIAMKEAQPSRKELALALLPLDLSGHCLSLYNVLMAQCTWMSGDVLTEEGVEKELQLQPS